MEEVQKKKKRKLDVVQDFSMRGLVEQVNALGIQKEDIVGFTPDPENGFYLLYFK